MAFNYYYDFEDCFQMSGGTGTTLTYVVGSNEVLNVGDTYRIFSISNPYQISCGLNMTASTSTAATHYTGVKNVYPSCNSCLTASTQIIQVSGFTNIGSNINLVGDIRYKKGDIINLDITYNLSGTKKFLKTPAVILSTSVYTSTASTIPNLIYYVPYDSYQQVIESKGLYYLVEDCSGGTQSIILSKYEILNQNQIVSIPTYVTSGNSPCVTVLTAITNGNYSQVSAVTTTLNSSLTFSSCTDCLTNYQSADTDETFAQNTYNADFIYDIKELADGSLVLGGAAIITADDGNLYNYGNLIKLNQDGSLDLTFNPNTEGSIYLDGSTFIYANYDDKFNLYDNFSIEFWIKFSSHEFNGGVITFKDSGADNGWQIRFDGNDNYLSFEYNSNTLTTSSQLNPDEWYHIAVVNNCNNDNLIIYINGVLDNSDTCTSNLVASEGTTLKIGIERTYDTYITGLITNVRIVNGDDNFVYNGTFTPQTSPLRRAQSSYDNVNNVNENQVVLLLNFIDKFNILNDSSVYKTPFYINKPNASILKSNKCACRTFRNNGATTTSLTYTPCYEPGYTVIGALPLYLAPSQFSNSICLTFDSLANVPPTWQQFLNPYGSDACVYLGGGYNYLCPGPCNCYTVKNNTSSPIQLSYYDCNRELINGGFIQPGAPEIQVCSIYFLPSTLTITNLEYQCSATTANYPYGWQCIPPVDPRCKPFIIAPPCGSGNSQPGNGPITAYTYSMVNESSSSFTPLVLNNTPSFFNVWGTLRYSADIAHTLNYTSNQGKLWISLVVDAAGTYKIYEYNLTTTSNGVFSAIYFRVINLPSGFSMGRGLTAKNNTTLISSRVATNTTAAQIVEIDVSSGANPVLNLTNANITTILSLPVGGQSFNTTSGLVTLLAGYKVNVVGDLILTDNDRLIVAGKQQVNAGDWSSAGLKVLLQYVYSTQTLNFIKVYATSPYISSELYSYNSNLYSISTGSVCAQFSKAQIDLSNGNFINTNVGNIPNGQSIYGASAPKHVGGTNVCGFSGLTSNII